MDRLKTRVRKNHQTGKRKLTRRHRLLYAAGLLTLAFICLSFVRFHVNQSISGDEPHYLLMDYSLVHDHDFNLANNYRHQDYLSYYPGYLSASTQVGRMQANSKTRQYSIHGIGLPLMLLPGYILDGPRGAQIEMLCVSLVTLSLAWYWVKLVTGSPSLALISAGLLLGSYMFIGLAGYLYPDMAVAAIVLFSLIVIAKFYEVVWAQVAMGALLGFAILLHFKAFAFAAPLLCVLTYKTWHYKHKLPYAALAVFGAMAVWFACLTYHWFGTFYPGNVYSAISLHASVVHVISAILFDSMRGLLVNCPAFLLLFVGAPVWMRKAPESALTAAVTVIPYMIILASFTGWQGGDSPVGRYLIDFLPTLMPAVAFALQQFAHLWQRIGGAILIAATMLITLDFTYIKRPYVRAEVHSPLFLQLHRHLGIAFDRLLPTFSWRTTVLGRHDWLKICIGYLILIALVVYGWQLSRHVERQPAPSQ